MRYAAALKALVAKQGWNLEQKFNRGYCGFKAGFFNAFGIGWWGSKTFGFFAKISEAEANRLKPRPCRYSKRWKAVYYPIDQGKTRVKDILPILDFAYHKLAGSAQE